MRLFVGIPPGEQARAVVADYVELCRRRWPEAKWVPAANLHYTVVFIGEVGEADLDVLTTALDNAAAPLAPFVAALGEPGRFPPRGKARVLWVGTSLGAEGMAAAAAATAQATSPWVAPEDRPFVAHLTIARFRVAAAVPELPPLDGAPEWTVDGVVLYRSRLARPAPVYEALHTARFRGAAAAGS